MAGTTGRKATRTTGAAKRGDYPKILLVKVDSKAAEMSVKSHVADSAKALGAWVVAATKLDDDGQSNMGITGVCTR